MKQCTLSSCVSYTCRETSTQEILIANRAAIPAASEVQECPASLPILQVI
jgi:hypothetical protein